MIKKIVIKLFKLTDISDILLKAKKQQKELDDRYWDDILQDKINSLTREHQLELQEKESAINMLEDHISSYKKNEKEQADRDFLSKKQIKENYFVVQNVVGKMQEFNTNVNKIYGEMLGIKDTVEKHKKRLEK